MSAIWTCPGAGTRLSEGSVPRICEALSVHEALRSATETRLPRGARAHTPTTVIGLRDRAARATVNATREAGRNLCAEAAKRGSPAARAGGPLSPRIDSGFAPMYTIAEGDAGHRLFPRHFAYSRPCRAQLGEWLSLNVRRKLSRRGLADRTRW